MELPFGVGRRWRRVVAGIVGTVTLAAGAVVGWLESQDVVPAVRLHPGVAWVASEEVGQLTLLDGASAEAVTGVLVGRRGADLYAAQQGSTGYALDRDRGFVVRVDGATLAPSRPMAAAEPGRRLAVFPTTDALYTLDTDDGEVTSADPRSLARRGSPFPLAVRADPEEAVPDAEGRLWVLDQRTGDLVWFADGVRRSRADAHTPDASRLTLTDGRPALLHPERGTMELLDPETGEVQRSVEVDLSADDTVAVSGSPRQGRLLVSVSSRGVLLSCSFAADSCAEPVSLGDGAGELGPAVEVGDRAVVPDYATGEVSIVDLEASRVLAQRRLFDRPGRFDLLTRDGVIFYNDPDSAQAGVIDLDGTVRPITKYGPGEPDSAEPAAGPADGAPPEVPDPGPGSQPANSLSISVRPDNQGLVGEEFELTAVPAGAAGIASARWDFGDGSRATGVTVAHRWRQPGSHQVRVVAQLRQAQVVTAVTRIAVESRDASPRIVGLNLVPEAPRTGQPVQFSADLAGGPPRRMAWTVTGDRGTETTSSASEFEHVFAAAGNYTVTLTVGDGAVSDRRSRRFSVAPAVREVECGDVLTTDALVTRDLVCAGTAVTIAADNVDLDLGGHTVSTDRPNADGQGLVIGAGEPIRRITVQHGSISNYPTGIAMVDVADVTIADVAVSASMGNADSPAVVGERVTETRLLEVTLSAYHPFRFAQESSVSITDSMISGNAGRGVANCSSDSSCLIVGGWIHVYSVGCAADDIEGNNSTVSIVGSKDVSVAYLGPYCETLSVSNSKINLVFDVSAGQSSISRNIITQSEAMAFWESFTVTRNQFLGGGSDGMHVFSGRGEVSGNRFVGKQGNGMVVNAIGDEPVGPLEIASNHFEGNGAGGDEQVGLDGLRVEMVGAGSEITVTGNRTVNNAQYGINSEPGLVVDGGGNRSSGDPFGCRNVVCAPG
jgi:PKD repeat protein